MSLSRSRVEVIMSLARSIRRAETYAMGESPDRLLECAREVTLAQGDAIRHLGALDLRAEMRLDVSQSPLGTPMRETASAEDRARKS